MIERANRPPLEDVYGPLPDWAIREWIERGVIKIEPLEAEWREKLGTMSIDFRLGETVIIPKHPKHKFIDIRKPLDPNDYDRYLLKKDETFVMQPNQFIIAPTYEKLTMPNDFKADLEGRSSFARIGLVVHLSSGRFDPGYDNLPVLELKNNSESQIILYGLWPVCAFSFTRLMAPAERSYRDRGRYTKDAILSLIHQDSQKIEAQKAENKE